MIAHVAEASEESGRVLLWLSPNAVSVPRAHEASVRVAAAYGSELETVVIDGPELANFAGLPVRFVSNTGKIGANYACDRDDSKGLISIAERRRREIDGRAARAHVLVHHARAVGDPIDRLAEMCLERGPWNIVAVERPASVDTASVLSSIFANVSGATAVVIAGRNANATTADVAVVIEDTERMPSMVRAGERLVMPSGKIHIFVVAETTESFLELDSHVRLLTSGRAGIVHATSAATFGVCGTFDEPIFKLRPNFVIARFGGSLLSDARALTRLLTISPAPFLLVR